MGGFSMSRHVAIKCTYNNGDEGIYVGFNGTCSENIMKWNIENGRVWCSQKRCECRKYYDNSFKGNKPIDPCYESVLFRDWEYGAGRYCTGKKNGTPIHLSGVKEGKIAILTTRFPQESEIDRRIIGFFKIGQVINNPNEPTKLIADRTFRIRLPMEEARELYFWDYYSTERTKEKAIWGTGLIRYLNDDQVVRILMDLKETLRDEKAKAMVITLLNQEFPKVSLPPVSGPRIRNMKSINRTKRIALIRKYGHGGEGIKHKKLKEWIAKNPQELGLSSVKRTEIEHVFRSGDIADIVFELNGNKYAVVEIELFDLICGCHQALKYKVLKCVELGLDINSSDVEAIIVIPSISQEVKEFCNKYGIRFVEKK